MRGRLAALRGRWMTSWVLLTVVVFVGVTLGPSLIGMRTLLSVNLLTNYFPWRAAGADTVGHASCTGDTVDSVMPGIAYMRHTLYSGHLPNWQGLTSGGSPLGSVPNLGLLNPLSLPYLVLPLWLAPAFVKLLELVAAIGGMFLFLRRLDVSRPAAILAGLVFATSGFMIVWTNWPQTRVAALIPALFWAVERLVQLLRPVDAALVALVVASMLLGGFPAVTGYSLYLAGAYFIARAVLLYRENVRALVRAGVLAVAGLVVGALLAMIQLLPFAANYGSSNLDYRSGYGVRNLATWGLLTLFAPTSHGLCIAGQRYHANSIELVAYVGSAALVLALLGAAAWRVSRTSIGRGSVSFFVVATLAILSIGWGSTVVLRVIHHLPVFSNNYVGRIRSVLGFTIAVLVGLGFDALMRHRQAAISRPWLAWVRGSAVWVVAVALGVDAVYRAHQTAIHGKYWGDVARALVVPGLLGIASLLVVGVARIPRLREHGRVLALVALPVLVAAQAAFFFHKMLPGDDPSDFYPQTATHRFLEHNLGHQRFDASSITMYPATALYYGLRTATGHAFHEDQWAALLRAADPKAMRTRTFSAFSSLMTPTKVADSPILDRMGVSYYVSAPSGVTGTVGIPGSASAASPVTVPAGGTASCSVPGGPLRGVVVHPAANLVAASVARGITFHVQVRSGERTISSGRFMSGAGRGTDVAIAVAGEDLSPGVPITVDVSVDGATSAMVLEAGASGVACEPVRPAADGLKLVYADAGSIIYQRLTALPRIRWASATEVVADPVQQVATLAAGVPANTVVLGAAGPAADGKPAQVSVLEDSGDSISARVVASGAGYLTVADAMQQRGWSATVDGKAVALVSADAAMVAIPVPAGTHRIAFDYRAPGQRVGAALSALAAGLIIGVYGWEWRRRRRPGRPRHAQQAETAAPLPDPVPEQVSLDLGRQDP